MTQGDMIANIARQMTRDIDQQVLMSATGWHELDIDQGQVHGSRYLTVHPRNSTKWNNMMSWMVDTFGPSAPDGVWTPNMRWYANNSKFWFQDEKDLMMFVLKWS